MNDWLKVFYKLDLIFLAWKSAILHDLSNHSVDFERLVIRAPCCHSITFTQFSWPLL